MHHFENRHQHLPPEVLAALNDLGIVPLGKLIDNYLDGLWHDPAKGLPPEDRTHPSPIGASRMVIVRKADEAITIAAWDYVQELWVDYRGEDFPREAVLGWRPVPEVEG